MESVLPQPLILTMIMDLASQDFFDRLRETHFPAECNFLRAHCTLFHALPGRERKAIEDDLARLATAQLPIPFQVSGVKFMGRGAAYALDCPPLIRLHGALQTSWGTWLTPQDKHRLWPHVTVQNKVTPARARETAATLAATFQPREGRGTGLALWAYQGGPWEPLGEFLFGKSTP